MQFASYEQVPSNVAQDIVKTRSGKMKGMDDE